jgi:hypothetical protein
VCASSSQLVCRQLPARMQPQSGAPVAAAAKLTVAANVLRVVPVRRVLEGHVQLVAHRGAATTSSSSSSSSSSSTSARGGCSCPRPSATRCCCCCKVPALHLPAVLAVTAVIAYKHANLAVRGPVPPLGMRAGCASTSCC